jgi:uncharacterized protein YaiI (UPF0178 family)
LRLWIDADALPNDLKDLIVRASTRLGMETVFVANKLIRLPPLPTLKQVVVGHGPDVADSHIVQHSEKGDVCVSQDIPLAALLVAKGVVVIDPRGDLHTEASIGERLSVRNFMQDLRDAGTVTGGPRPFDAKAKQAFAATFDRVLTQALRG